MDITRELSAWQDGDAGAYERLRPFVHDELRRLADRCFASEPAGHLWQPTALVNEAFLKLVDQERCRWQSRAHFFAVAARIMRRLLVDQARRRALRPSAAGSPATIEAGLGERLAAEPVDLVALDDALATLAGLDERQARLVELRAFAGASLREAAEALAISPATAKRDWALARAWLYEALHGGRGGA